MCPRPRFQQQRENAQRKLPPDHLDFAAQRFRLHLNDLLSQLRQDLGMVNAPVRTPRLFSPIDGVVYASARLATVIVLIDLPFFLARLRLHRLGLVISQTQNPLLIMSR